MKNSLLTLLILTLIMGCKERKETIKATENAAIEETTTKENTDSDVPVLTKPTIITHVLDEQGSSQLLDKYGENASEVFADLMFYGDELKTLADSLGIPMQTYNEREMRLKYGDKIFEHVQDTAAGLQSAFYYDGKTIEQHDLLELIALLGGQ